MMYTEDKEHYDGKVDDTGKRASVRKTGFESTSDISDNQ